MRSNQTLKAQSAVEYLTTYGWAILIIAIVLAALFILGVFNPWTYALKAQTGACYVYNPAKSGASGPRTLQGVCNNEIPQFVAKFNGVSSNITTGTPFVYNTLNNFTISLWAETSSSGNPNSMLIAETVPLVVGSYNSFPVVHTTFYVSPSPNGELLVTCSAESSTGFLPSSNEWVNFVLTTGKVGSVTAIYLYANGRQLVTAVTSNCISNPSNPLVVGSADGNANFFNGEISNIQIYNTSLSSNDIDTLYLEGIGGSPLRLQNLVVWYPLNGDSKDYGGNQDNAAASNVVSIGGWEGSYTTP